MRNELIFIIGPESSGKTMQAQIIYRWLRKKGKKTIIVKIADQHLLAYIFTKALMLLGRRTVYYLPHGRLYIGLDHNIIKRSFNLWTILNIISALLTYLFKVKFPNLVGYTVVCEGHPIHAVVNIYNIARFHGLNVKGKALINILLRLLQNNCILILLDAPYDVLLRRYKSGMEDAEPIWYIQVQKKFIKYIVHNYSSLFIDTSKHGIFDTFHKIKILLSELLNR